MYGAKMWFIKFWYVAGPLQSPCCNTRLSMVPLGELNNVFHTSSSTTRICSYASVPSITDRYRCAASLSNTSVWSGNGDAIFLVFALISRLSKHALNRIGSSGFLRAFWISNIGIGFVPVATLHLPVLKYSPLFCFHNGSSARAHFDGRYLYTFDSSIKGLSLRSSAYPVLSAVGPLVQSPWPLGWILCCQKNGVPRIIS